MWHQEGGRKKSSLYWPQLPESQEEYGVFKVKLKLEEEEDHFTRRKFELEEPDGTVREVTHIQVQERP